MSRASRFARFGVVGYKDDTGIGRQCHNMRSVLGLGHQLVAPSTRLPGHVINSQTDLFLSPTASRDELRALLNNVSGLIIIERNKWHAALFEMSKEMGKTLIVVPNWEWFDASDPSYQLVDIFVVHSRFALLFLNSSGFQNAILLPPPIDTALLPLRRIRSRPTCFIHNAGIIDQNDRKGTLLVIEAWAKKKPSRSRLILRYQKSELPFQTRDLPPNILTHFRSTHSPAALYASGHCAIQPSKLEGLGYMVLEPIICGIPTITTNAPPMNEWLAGTFFCEALPSLEVPVARRRGIGSASLYEVDTLSLPTQLEP